MKTIKKLAMALALVAMPLLANAQGDLPAFDLKGKVKSCTWVNHKAGCMQYGFSETANKEITEFDQNGRCTNGTTSCSLHKEDQAQHCITSVSATERDAS